MRLKREFFVRDVLDVAPDLVGKVLVRRLPDGSELRLTITETEAYRGEEDSACHAHKGRTKRSEMLYHRGGTIYVYLCYGVHWLMNIVTGEVDQPQAALIRACEAQEGPGKLTKALRITGSLNGKDVCESDELWIEDVGNEVNITTATRVGIKYADEVDIDRLWRFVRG